MAGIYAGIDYSLTSPGVCVIDVDKNKIRLHGFSSTKHQGVYTHDNITICLDAYPSHTCPQDRHDKLATWTLSHLPEDITSVTLEGFSFASRSGLICDIAENTSILKHKLWRRNIAFQTIAPTSLKKYATGKGTADKNQMHEAFVSIKHISLQTLLGFKSGKIGSPVSDLVDAFFLADHCRENFE